MRQKHKHQNLNRYIISIFVCVVIAAAAAVVVTRHKHTDAAPTTKPPVGAAVPSEFKFTGTPGWWQGATNKTSMALFHRTDGCFTSIQHKSGTVDVTHELQKRQNSLADSYTVTSLGTVTATLQTASGPLQYELHQSSVVTPAGADKLMGGQEFGWVQLHQGYLEVWGYCDTADQLTATIPALQAIKFDQAD